MKQEQNEERGGEGEKEPREQEEKKGRKGKRRGENNKEGNKIHFLPKENLGHVWTQSSPPLPNQALMQLFLIPESSDMVFPTSTLVL